MENKTTIRVGTVRKLYCSKCESDGKESKQYKVWTGHRWICLNCYPDYKESEKKDVQRNS